MPLTDISIKAAKPAAKPVKLFDAGGLFLIVTPAGDKWWRLKYRFQGKAKTLSLGTYPTVSLKDARERRDELRRHSLPEALTLAWCVRLGKLSKPTPFKRLLWSGMESSGTRGRRGMLKRSSCA